MDSISDLQLVFLGTGTSQGVPTIGCDHPVCLSDNPRDKRLRSSVLIQKSNKNYLVDCGPDMRQQLLRENISNVEAVLLTHEHNDHILGLDDIRPLIFKAKKRMPFYARERVNNELKNRFPYAFADKPYPGVPAVELNNISDEVFWLNDLKVESFAVMHGKLEIHGFIFDDELVYMTDVSYLSDEVREKLHNKKRVVCSALRKEPKHFSHLILDESLALMQEIKPEKAYFTHISHLMGFHEEVQNELPANHFLAYDGLKVNLKN